MYIIRSIGKFLLLILPILMQAEDTSLRPIEAPALFETGGEFIPWLTGPLLTPSGNIIPAPHFQIKPRVFIQNRYARYDSHWHSHDRPNFLQVQSTLIAKVGLTQKVDVFVVPNVTYNHSQGASFTGFGDFTAGFEFQLYKRSAGQWFPSTKLTLYETFPTGKYQHLSASKYHTDAVGTGSYISAATLGMSRLFHLEKHHFLEIYAGASYRVYSPVHVKKLNTYGGASDTNGREFPGNFFLASFGMEYTLTQRWVLAMDLRYEHRNRFRFQGKPGFLASGEKATMTHPSSEQFIFAPQIEYNWSADIGIIAGPWFSFAGRNKDKFNGGIIAFSYYK